MSFDGLRFSPLYDHTERELNQLMAMALQKVAFLPFGYMIDKWRWAVFSGDITPEEYNTKWWQYRYVKNK